MIRQSWRRFFFAPTDAFAMAILRIGVAALFICQFILVLDDVNTWYGADKQSLVPVGLARSFLPPGLTVSLLTAIPLSSDVLSLAVSLALILGPLLLLGFHSRLSALGCFVIMQSFLHRNPFVISAADELLSQLLFYLSMSNAGSWFSFDSKRLNSGGDRKTAPWVQRLIQLQLSLIYLQTAFFKSRYPDWTTDGNAVFRALHSRELSHYPVPDFIFSSEPICRLLTWSTLGVEFALPVIVWIPALRNYAVLFGIVFHLCMEYCLNIPYFQALMILCLLTFIDEKAYAQLVTNIKAAFRMKGSVSHV